MGQHFLVEHDRHGKIPTRITIYEDLSQANERLYRLEDDQMDELEVCLRAGSPVRMEYVVLGGASIESIKQTHGRYFGGEFEVVTPSEVHYISSWSEKSNWSQEERIAAEAEAFARAITRP